MKWALYMSVFFLFWISAAPCDGHDTPAGFSVDPPPEQIHLAATETVSAFIVMWTTFTPSSESVVKYGLAESALTSNVSGKMVEFNDSKKLRYIHSVELTGLKPGTKYSYSCGSGQVWSKVYTFTTLKEGSDWSPHFVVYGDLGYQNGQCIPSITKEVMNGRFDVALHVGDLAYDLHDNGDDFMNSIEDIAARLPYMVAPGNHEEWHNFTHYRNRFKMPGNSENYFYSWNIGPAHIISFSTEVYFFLEYGLFLPKWQYEWLEQDLKAANSPEQRAQRPWIITMGHRPMYCADDDGDDCNKVDSIVRTGIPIIHKYPLEKLFYQYGVDIEIWGHEHNYERFLPLYDRKVYNGSDESPYVNPKAPVHFITGAPGNREGHDKFDVHLPSWFAFGSTDFSYTHMTVINATHLLWEQISTSQGGKAIDSVMVVKDKHGPEAWQ